MTPRTSTEDTGAVTPQTQNTHKRTHTQTREEMTTVVFYESERNS